MDIVITTSLSRVGVFVERKNGEQAQMTGEMNSLIDTSQIFDALPAEIVVDLKQVANIYIDIGPGGTSSVRTGVAIANTLAYVNNAVLHPIPSSKIMIEQALAGTSRHRQSTLCFHRSIRGQVFCSRYLHSGEFNISYGQLSSYVPVINGMTDAHLLIDQKTQSELLDLLPDSTAPSFCQPDEFAVSLPFFAQHRQRLAAKAVRPPQVAIPFTESQAES